MKKTLILISIVILALSSASQAQFFSYGAKLGLSFPGFQEERIASERITPAFSLVGNLNISKSLLVQSELGFELKGNKFTYQAWDEAGNVIEDSTYNEKTNLGYVTVPLFIKYNLGRANKFYAQLGGYYGYLLNASYTGKIGDEVVTKVPLKDELNKHDFGLVVGGGLVTPVRRGLSMLLDVKYNLGLNDLKADSNAMPHMETLKTKNFIMSMGVVIDIE